MIEIELTQGQVALVDDIDADLAEFKWSAEYDPSIKNFYARRKTGGRFDQTRIHMHRVIMERILQRELSIGEFVDHVYHKTLDNRRNEIRLVTNSQNRMNGNIRCDNTSGYKGVSWHIKKGKYMAYIQAKYIGYFDTPEDAARAYNDKAVELFGGYALLNEV